MCTFISVLKMSTYVIVKKHTENVRKRNSMFAKLQRRSEKTAFALENDEFKRMFVLSKKNVRHLCNILYKELAPKCGTQTSIPVEIKVLSALRYFASGHHQKDVGEESILSISQATVSRYVMLVSDAICNKILDNTVTFPSQSQYKSVEETFSKITGFPGAIGVVGCCHIPIAAPSKNSRFRNSKGQHSINVLLVCDANMRISFVDASYPGASLDWFVWKLSKIRFILEAGWRKGENHSWLLASKRFQPEPWLLTPFKDPTSEAQKAYNRCHARALGVMDRCRHLLMSRFGGLRRILRMGPNSTEQIIRACVVLHNMCLDENVNEDVKEDISLDGQIEESDLFVPIDNSMHDSAIRVRERVVQDHFS